MTDAETLRKIAAILPVLWIDSYKDLMRIADRLEDLDRGVDPRDGVLGQK